MTRIPIADLRATLDWAERELGIEGATVRDLVLEIEALRWACKSALAWVQNMKIVPGGERDRLRIQLCRALGIEP